MNKLLKHRAAIIAHLIETYKYNSVLEIGVRGGPVPQVIFEQRKWSHIKYDGIDPVAATYVNHVKTSDQFFSEIKDTKKWDLIFIDGLHIMEQCDKDLENSFKHLNAGGTMVMHDCNPPSKWHQRPLSEYSHGEWNGTVWKSYIKLRVTRPDLFMYVIDTDWGVGIIQHGKQKVYDSVEEKIVLDYDYLASHRTEMLNLISIDEFKKMTSNVT